MLVIGLEPIRGCPRGILSPLRLPIPPHQRIPYLERSDSLAAYKNTFSLYALSWVSCAGSKNRVHNPFDLLCKSNGWRWIRTTEAICSRFTVCPLWPLGNPSICFSHYKNIAYRYLKSKKFFKVDFSHLLKALSIIPVSSCFSAEILSSSEIFFPSVTICSPLSSFFTGDSFS